MREKSPLGFSMGCSLTAFSPSLKVTPKCHHGASNRMRLRRAGSARMSISTIFPPDALIPRTESGLPSVLDGDDPGGPVHERRPRQWPEPLPEGDGLLCHRRGAADHARDPRGDSAGVGAEDHVRVEHPAAPRSPRRARRPGRHSPPPGPPRRAVRAAGRPVPGAGPGWRAAAPPSGNGR